MHTQDTDSSLYYNADTRYILQSIMHTQDADISLHSSVLTKDTDSGLYIAHADTIYR